MSDRWAVIVNGPPGSGKSTLAGPLARELGVPLLAKDAVKETLLDTLGYADRAESRRIGAASGEVLWTLLAGCPDGGVVESWLAPSLRDVVRAGLDRADVERVVEVWCDCAPETALQRYAARQRHPGHFDDVLLPELPDVIATAEPLALGPVVQVRTEDPVDVATVVQLVRAALGDG
ncbi:MAG: AAA family ATPase [Candidatus Nanopelagicales bacterium]